MVEQPTHHPELEGSNPADAGSGKEKIPENLSNILLQEFSTKVTKKVLFSPFCTFFRQKIMSTKSSKSLKTLFFPNIFAYL